MSNNNTPATIEAKPLNATQMKNLRELVEIDFRELSSVLTNDLIQRVSRRKQAITDSFSGHAAKEAAMNDEIARLCEEAKTALHAKVAKVIQKHGGAMNERGLVAVTPLCVFHIANDMNDQLNRLATAHQRLKGQCDTVIRRERSRIDRQILLQGITPGVNDLVNDLPNADDIMSMVTAETAMTHADDIETLLGNAPIVPEIGS